MKLSHKNLWEEFRIKTNHKVRPGIKNVYKNFTDHAFTDLRYTLLKNSSNKLVKISDEFVKCEYISSGCPSIPQNDDSLAFLRTNVTYSLNSDLSSFYTSAFIHMCFRVLRNSPVPTPIMICSHMQGRSNREARHTLGLTQI